MKDRVTLIVSVVMLGFVSSRSFGTMEIKHHQKGKQKVPLETVVSDYVKRGCEDLFIETS